MHRPAGLIEYRNPCFAGGFFRLDIAGKPLQFAWFQIVATPANPRCSRMNAPQPAHLWGSSERSPVATQPDPITGCDMLSFGSRDVALNAWSGSEQKLIALWTP